MSTNNTELYYQGNIELSINIKGKLYKVSGQNKGTSYLKYVFAKMLGNEFDSNDTPGFIALYKVTSEEEPAIEVTNKKVSISGNPVFTDEDDSGWPTAVTFTAYLGYDNLTEEIKIWDTAEYYFYLFPRKGSQHLAEIKVDKLSLSYITPGVTATVTWTLRLLNKGE